MWYKVFVFEAQYRHQADDGPGQDLQPEVRDALSRTRPHCRPRYRYNIGVVMTTNGTPDREKYFDAHSNSEIAREIILNALYEIVIKDQYDTFNNYYLEQVENDWGNSRAVAVRKLIVKYIWRIFNKYHTSKFDMSGHRIVSEVFHQQEKTGDMPKDYYGPLGYRKSDYKD